MVNYPTILNLPQKDINRQLYERVLKLQAKAKYHVLSLTINDSTDPISGATVTIGSDSVTTGADGKCKFELVDGTYDISVTKTGYADGSSSVTISGKNVAKTITLTEAVSTGTVTVTCKDESENLLNGVEVLLYEGEPYGDPYAYGTTDSNGVTTLTLYETQDTSIAFGTYTLIAQYVDAQQDSYSYMNNLTVDGDESVTATLTLE